VAASSEDPRVAVASLAAARRAVSAVVTHAVAAGAIALLTAGFSALGFLPPPATIGLVALTALAPLRRRGGRSAFAALEGKG
jgi:hypothetical protein